MQAILEAIKGVIREKNPGFFNFCCRRRCLFKFWLVGLAAGAIDLFALFVIHHFLAVPIISAATLAFIISFLLTFGFHRRWTFAGGLGGKRQYLLYILNIFACLNLNALLMHLLANRLGLWFLLSQLAVNIVIGLYNFLIYRFIIFQSYGSRCS